MIFRQPNNLARVMHQILDQVERGKVVTLAFDDTSEAQRGLTVLHEVARSRNVGVLATPVGTHEIELRVARDVA